MLCLGMCILTCVLVLAMHANTASLCMHAKLQKGHFCTSHLSENMGRFWWEGGGRWEFTTFPSSFHHCMGIFAFSRTRIGSPHTSPATFLPAWGIFCPSFAGAAACTPHGSWRLLFLFLPMKERIPPISCTIHFRRRRKREEGEEGGEWRAWRGWRLGNGGISHQANKHL